MWLFITLANVAGIRGCRRSFLQLFLREGKPHPVGRQYWAHKPTSRVGMFNVWYFTSENELAIYQKLWPLTLQVTGHKYNNREIYQVL
jgi:hypothetical protein